MKVVILCGGLGTRMREYTATVPKPLVNIGDRPILWHLMKIYSHYGFKDFILCLGYKGEMISDYFGDSKNIGEEQWNIDFADTGLETNTGGRIKRVEDMVDGHDFFATYGDGLANIDVRDLLEFHTAKKKVATITSVNPLSQFGIMDIDEDGIITKFREKPPLGYWVNGGFFVFNRRVFDYLEEDDVLEKGPFEKLSRDGNAVAYKFRGFWACMDTYKDTQMLNDMWASGNAPWKIWQ